MSMDGPQQAAMLTHARICRNVSLILAASRDDLDVTQTELAERLGWSRNMVANMEKGRKAVTVADFVLFARALRIDPALMLRRVLQW